MGKVIMSGKVPKMREPGMPENAIKASDLAVGNTVKINNVNGQPLEFLIVHKGLPSSIYDASCDGVWLLYKYVSTERAFDSDNNAYVNSDIQNWLNTFPSLFEEAIRPTIKTVKIPYCSISGGTSVQTGSNGMEVQFFSLSACEVGRDYNTYAYNTPHDGDCLDYFSGGSNTIAYDTTGTARAWWTRSASKENSTYAFYVGTNGVVGSKSCSSGNQTYDRPALIVPHSAIFHEETMVLMGHL